MVGGSDSREESQQQQQQQQQQQEEAPPWTLKEGSSRSSLSRSSLSRGEDLLEGYGGPRRTRRASSAP